MTVVSRGSSWLLMALLLGMVSLVHAQDAGDLDYSQWERYRAQVQHPAGVVKPADLERAKANLERHEWSRKYVEGLRTSADALLPQITPEYLTRMVDVASPSSTGPCPACRAKGLAWHPNGQWSWSSSNPDQITCQVCKTVFPNDDFPESVVLQSRWDPTQRYTFCGGEAFLCFGYMARPSFTGMIRGRKFGYVSGQLSTLASAYGLLGDVRYARAAKDILLRLAEVFPHYLVRAGYSYGEIADMDPHVAARQINNLPEDELVYPPNKPDRRLHTGYWSASRIGTSGMDGGWVGRMALAYDLVCTAVDKEVAVFSEDERKLIERDLLIEGAYLAYFDQGINNKSVGNRCGAAAVGMVVGLPALTHFGLEGFRKTVDDWFLPDGGTSESAAYAMMTMGGVMDFALLFRGYSDPEGYRDAEGLRLDNFNACLSTRFGDCWQSLLWTLQGNLRHPPAADSYRTTGISGSYAEYLQLCYPTPQHLAFLRETVAQEPTGGAAYLATLYRDPNLADSDRTPFLLPDVVFPYLAQGFLRTGDTGRDSLLMLNASDFGGHHHLDSLDLYYWKDGQELLSDLGYLWDHPDSYQTRRTFSHNTVMLDATDQKTRGRAGSFHLFATTPAFKVMEASSKAYDKASVYRRTCVQVDHGAAGSYALDLFRVQGGATRDYILHGPGTKYQVEGLNLSPFSPADTPLPFAIRFPLTAVGEICVDDVAINEVLPAGGLGPNLAPNPSATSTGKTLSGWGFYSGDGKGEWGPASPGRTDQTCARAAGLQGDANTRVNLALLAGDADGYRGLSAIRGRSGGRYRLSFWIRGTVPVVNPDVIYWPNDPSSPSDRFYVRLGTLTPTAEWTRCEFEFALPSNALPLTKVQSAEPDGPWQVRWSLSEPTGDKPGYGFTAWTPASPGETVLLGDGWGQRDHKNTDRGATLPYVVRQRRGSELSTFVTVFEGAATGKELVTGVRILPAPAGAPADLAVIEVRTREGTDVFLSALTPTRVTCTTALGDLTTDGRFAGLLGLKDRPQQACLVGGTRLEAPGVKLSSPVASYHGTIADKGRELTDSWFVLEGALPPADLLKGATLLVTDGDYTRAYPVRDVETDGARLKAHTKRDAVGVQAFAGTAWEVLPVVSLRNP